jgi:membrane-associated protease RseP (regulator of RpoE activity)
MNTINTLNNPPIDDHVNDAAISTRNTWNTTLGGVVCAGWCVYLIMHAPLIGAYLAIVSALVIVHEGAHMYVARRNGLVVEEYAVGFGPKVLSLTTPNMTWSLRGIPAGGFVKIAGPSVVSKVPEGIDETETLRGCSRKARVATIAAGPVSNLVLAVLLSAFAFGVLGHPTGNGGHVRLAPHEAVVAGVKDTVTTATVTLSGLGHIVTGADDYTKAVASGDREQAPASFLSPIGAANAIGTLDDPALIVRFAAVISAGLGVFNFLPFLPLDGGHLFIEAIETIRSKLAGKRVRTSVKTLNWATGATLAALLLLTVSSLRFDLMP